MKPITPETFQYEVEKILTASRDAEVVHPNLDELCWKLLSDLGYAAGIAAIHRADGDGRLWYS